MWQAEATFGPECPLLGSQVGSDSNLCEAMTKPTRILLVVSLHRCRSLHALHFIAGLWGMVQTCNDATTNCRDPPRGWEATVTAPRPSLATASNDSNHVLGVFLIQIGDFDNS